MHGVLPADEVTKSWHLNPQKTACHSTFLTAIVFLWRRRAIPGFTISVPFDGNEIAMNYVRTAVLLAALTALLMGLGYLLGGRGGALIAFFVAATGNFFA